jgi:hypothetical protein
VDRNHHGIDDRIECTGRPSRRGVDRNNIGGGAYFRALSPLAQGRGTL